MKTIKIFGLVALLATCLMARQAKAEANYEACAGLNDYLSYSKCVAEIDSKTNGTPTAVVADLKSQIGEYSLVIDDSSGQSTSRYVVLNLTASTSTVKIAIAKDSNFGFAARQIFANKVWRLLEDTPGEVQYVYVKFFNEAGDSLGVVGAPVKYLARATDKTKEILALNNFLKIFKRQPDTKKPVDNAWLEIVAYGLKQEASKDEAKETIALSKFISTFKRLPAGDDWSLIHALAYSQILADLAIAKPASTTDTVAVVTETISTDKTCQAKQTFKTVMDIGSKGAEVEALQEFFQCLGFLEAEAKISETFDTAAEEASKKFQEQYGLKCNNGKACGHVGPATVKKLNEVSAAAKTAVANEVAPFADSSAETTTSSAIVVKLKINLTVGSRGAEVTALQKFLAQDTEIYPEGKVTGIFGPLTEAAVKRFQTRHELMCRDKTACGYVGPATRKKIEEVSAQ